MFVNLVQTTVVICTKGIKITTAMDKQKSIKTLQFFVTGLSNGAFRHLTQSRIFKSQGYEKLATRFKNHAEEEYGWVEKFMDRILDLGGVPKVENRQNESVVCDPIEHMSKEYDIQQSGVELLAKCMAEITDDVTTYDLLKDYYKDEEDDQFEDEKDLDLIKKLGEANWLLTQL